jgi:hypothetical protein
MPMIGAGTGSPLGGGGHSKEWKTQKNYYVELSAGGIDLSLSLVKVTFQRTAEKPYPLVSFEFLVDSQELPIMKKVLGSYDIKMKMYVYGNNKSSYKIIQGDFIFVGHKHNMQIDDIKRDTSQVQSNYVPYGIICIPKLSMQGLIKTINTSKLHTKLDSFIGEVESELDIKIKRFHITDNKATARQIILHMLNGHRIMDFLHYFFGYYNGPMVYWWKEHIYQGDGSKPTLWVWDLQRKLKESDGDVQLYVTSASHKGNKEKIAETGTIANVQPYGSIMKNYLTLEATPISHEVESFATMDAYNHHIVWHPHKELYRNIKKEIKTDIMDNWGVVDGTNNYDRNINKLLKEKKQWTYDHTGYYPWIGKPVGTENDNDDTEILYNTWLSSKASSLYKIKAMLYYTIDPDSLIPFSIWKVNTEVPTHKKIYGKFYLHSSNLEIIRDSVGVWQGSAEVHLARTNTQET